MQSLRRQCSFRCTSGCFRLLKSQPVWPLYLSQFLTEFTRSSKKLLWNRKNQHIRGIIPYSVEGSGFCPVVSNVVQKCHSGKACSVILRVIRERVCASIFTRCDPYCAFAGLFIPHQNDMRGFMFAQNSCRNHVEGDSPHFSDGYSWLTCSNDLSLVNFPGHSILHWNHLKFQ